MIFKFFASVAIIYIVLFSLLYLFQGKLIFFSQPTHPGNLSRFAANEIHFDRGDVTLTGWVFKRDIDGGNPLIVYYGGNAEDVSLNFTDLERFVSGSFLFMNYRGYGKSTGTPTEKALLDDAVYVLDHFLETEKVDPKSVVLMGRSLGSGVAVHVAAKRSVGGVILVTPFDSLAAVAQSHYPIFPTGLLLKHRFDSAALAPGISTPSLFLMAEKDRVVPKRFAARLKTLWGGPVSSLVVKGVDHNNIETSTVYWDAINRFLATRG